MKKNINSVVDRSGSCAVVMLVTPTTIYVANVGDSRAIMSSNGGHSFASISRDHKPGEIGEKTRIERAGGKIYQSNVINPSNQAQSILGPVRVLPGRLSVSRTFGDCMAKFEKYGGNPRCIVAEPDIFKVPNKADLDFILIASDGIFDRIETDATCKLVVDQACASVANSVSDPQGGLSPGKRRRIDFETVSRCCGHGVDRVMTAAME